MFPTLKGKDIDCFNFSAWLYDQDSPAVIRLSQLINALTNLSMETAEPLQVIGFFCLIVNV
jgi:hypothetical protein